VGNPVLYRNPAKGLTLSRRKFFSAAAFLASGGPAWPQAASPGDTLDEIVARGSVRIGMYDDFAPYSFLEEGEIRGIDAEAGKIIAESLGVKAELELRRADENVDADLRSHVWRGPVTGGDVVNVMLHMPIERQLALRNDMVAMGGSYASEKTVLAWSKTTLGDIPTMTDFTEHRIAVENDSIADFYLAGFAGGAIVKNLIHVPAVAQAVAAMAAGEAAAVMGPMAQLEYEIGKLGDRRANYGIAKTSPPGLSQGTWSFGFAVRMNYRDLYYAVEEALASAVSDGRIKAAYQKFGLTYNPPPPPSE
jgi:ABC-type amino acid transport substrate-binding protein